MKFNQFSCSVVSDSLWPHGLHHARLPLPCPPPTPGAYSNSCPSSLIPSNHLVLCHPLLLPSIFPSIRVFSNESVLFIRWLKYWSFSFTISPSKEYSGLISFRIDWFDLAVQRILDLELTVDQIMSSLLQKSFLQFAIYHTTPLFENWLIVICSENHSVWQFLLSGILIHGLS